MGRKIDETDIENALDDFLRDMPNIKEGILIRLGIK